LTDLVPLSAEIASVSASDQDAAIVKMWLHGRPDSTRRVYGPIVGEFLRHVRKPLRTVTIQDLQSFQSSLADLAVTTQSKKLSAVKSLLTYAHKAGYLAVNVGVVLQMPKIKNTLAERILSEADVQRMIQLEPNHRNHMMLRLLYMGGLRREELCALRVRDMRKHGKGGKLTVFGKGGKTRIVPLPGSIWNDLVALAGEDRDGSIFHSAGGKPLSSITPWRIVKAAAKRAGLPGTVACHHLRHSHASHALDHGCPVHVLQAVLGHASLVTTSRYVHVGSNESSADYLSDE
jgi:integrase/recombinase XerD